MTASQGERPQAVVTTSWDDGHPLDARLADLLSHHGVRGTFYVPLRNAERPVLSSHDIQELSRGFEIAAHTRSHVDITSLKADDLWSEVGGAKAELEAILGHAVTAFCYPRGKFSTQVRSVVARAGFQTARTTVGFRWDWNADRLLMPTSVQAYPHHRLGHVGHAVKEKNWRGGANYLLHLGARGDWLSLALRMLDIAITNGGWWHLWGHSWEIDQLDAWGQLDCVLGEAGRSGAIHLTNTELGALLRS